MIVRFISYNYSREIAQSEIAFSSCKGNRRTMARNSGKQSRNRIVIETPSTRYARNPRSVRRQPGLGTREGLVAISVIAAAALATFIALFLTSRPYDPMNSTVLPQESVPQGPVVAQPSPKPSPSTSPQPKQSGEPSPESADESAKTGVTDDATIQAQIEKALASDPALAKLDVSTLVEGGKVTVVGSVRSADLKTRVEKTVSSVKGVASVDNRLVVTEATP